MPFFCRGTRQQRRQKKWGKLHQFKWRALQGTRHLNPGLDLDQADAPVLKVDNDNRVTITNSTGYHRVFWRCCDCQHDRQHMRLCTSKSIQSEQDLACRFCPLRPQIQQSTQLHSAVCSSEAAFIQLLWSHGLDQQYCHQVVADFWKWPIDFYNYVQDFWVLIDDRHHWTGIRQYSKAIIADKDMRLNQAALAAHKTVVRVARGDISEHGCVLAALAAAASGAVFVLTPAYAQLLTAYQGDGIPYEVALKNCAIQAGVQMEGSIDYAGNDVFRLM